MRIVTGNLLDISNGIICQQCNMKGVMGMGLALQIRKKWPNVYDDYKHYVNYGKLGDVIYIQVSNHLVVANLLAQQDYGTNGKRYTDYIALEKALKDVYSVSHNMHIPHGIGCGLAGGNWFTVSDIISRVCPDATIVKLPV